MARQARDIPKLLKQQYSDLEPKTRKLFTTEEIFSFQKILLTGCGDSYATCLAAKPAFEEFAKVPVEVISAIDLSRHYAESNLNYGPNSPLVIAVSNSGQVARLYEAIIRANKTSAFTVGVTKNVDSPLGTEAKRVLKLDPPKFESAPGVGSYAISLLTLLLIAIRLGEVKLSYTMDQANVYRKSILKASEEMSGVIDSMDNQIFKLSKVWENYPGFDFIGSGADYGSVFFGRAKIIEAVGKYAMYTNTEEWLHLNFFLRNSEQTGTVVVIDQSNEAISRMQEVLEYMKMNKRPILIITNSDKLLKEYKGCIAYPSGIHKSIAALFQLIPLSLLASYLSKLIGETYGRGTEGNWEFSKGAKAVKQSEIKII